MIVARCARQHGVASGDQIVDLGLSRQAIRRRVRAKTLFEIYDDAFSLSPVVSADGRRAAAVLSITKGRTMLTAWSGAELFRMARRPDDRHHVVTMRGGVRDRDGLVISHTRLELPHRRVRGIPVTEPLRVLLDIGVDLRGRELERLVGEALYLRLVRDGDIDNVARRYPGHPGLVNLGAISPEEARNRRTVMPLAERMLLAIDALAVPPPICEYEVYGHSGKRYRADFAWPELRIILEADGRDTHTRRKTMEDDHFRNTDLLAAGWRTVRFTGRQFDRDRRSFDEFVVALLG
ncbi:MAG: DUF559 domain-containing protein [Solirubrobacteraceae bacterium]|nr:DUF559 domain-containing protein [Solirubrobacteraceae bacterium]